MQKGMLQFWACRDIHRNSADGAGVCWSVALGWTEQRNVWKIHSAGTDTIPCICLRGCYGWNIWSCILAGFALLEGKESWLGMVIDWMRRLLSRWDLQLDSQIHTIRLDLTFDMLNAWQFPLPLVICAGYLLLLIAKLLGKCSDPHPCTLWSHPHPWAEPGRFFKSWCVYRTSWSCVLLSVYLTGWAPSIP